MDPTQSPSTDSQNTSFLASLVPILAQRWRLLVLTAVLGGLTGSLASALISKRWEAVTSISIGRVPADPLGRLTDQQVPLAPLEEIIDWANSETTLRPLFDDERRLRQTKVSTHVLSSSLLRIVVTSPNKDDALRVAESLANSIEEQHKERFEQWRTDTSAMAERLRKEVNAVNEHLAKLPPTTSAADSLALFAERRQLAELDRQAVVASMALNPMYARASSTVSPPAVKPRPKGMAKLLPILKTGATGSLLATLIAVLTLFVMAQVPSSSRASQET